MEEHGANGQRGHQYALPSIEQPYQGPFGTNDFGEPAAIDATFLAVLPDDLREAVIQHQEEYIAHRRQHESQCAQEEQSGQRYSTLTLHQNSAFGKNLSGECRAYHGEQSRRVQEDTAHQNPAFGKSLSDGNTMSPLGSMELIQPEIDGASGYYISRATPVIQPGISDRALHGPHGPGGPGGQPKRVLTADLSALEQMVWSGQITFEDAQQKLASVGQAHSTHPHHLESLVARDASIHHGDRTSHRLTIREKKKTQSATGRRARDTAQQAHERRFHGQGEGPKEKAKSKLGMSLDRWSALEKQKHRQHKKRREAKKEVNKAASKLNNSIRRMENLGLQDRGPDHRETAGEGSNNDVPFHRLNLQRQLSIDYTIYPPPTAQIESESPIYHVISYNMLLCIRIIQVAQENVPFMDFTKVLHRVPGFHPDDSAFFTGGATPLPFLKQTEDHRCTEPDSVAINFVFIPHFYSDGRHALGYYTTTQAGYNHGAIAQDNSIDTLLFTPCSTSDLQAAGLLETAPQLADKVDGHTTEWTMVPLKYEYAADNTGASNVRMPATDPSPSFTRSPSSKVASSSRTTMTSTISAFSTLSLTHTPHAAFTPPNRNLTLPLHRSPSPPKSSLHMKAEDGRTKRPIPIFTLPFRSRGYNRVSEREGSKIAPVFVLQPSAQMLVGNKVALGVLPQYLGLPNPVLRTANLSTNGNTGLNRRTDGYNSTNSRAYGRRGSNLEGKPSPWFEVIPIAPCGVWFPKTVSGVQRHGQGCEEVVMWQEEWIERWELVARVWGEEMKMFCEGKGDDHGKSVMEDEIMEM